jgi:hypothetical protein
MDVLDKRTQKSLMDKCLLHVRQPPRSFYKIKDNKYASKDGSTVAYFNDKKNLHNESGIAFKRCIPGVRTVEEYWSNGQLHRPISEGPAVIHTSLEGDQVINEYWTYGLRRFINLNGHEYRVD